MPTRSYTNIDLVQIDNTQNLINSILTTNDKFHIVGNGSVSGAGVQCLIVVNRHCTIDYAGLFPTIPDTAIITRITANIDAIMSATVTSPTTAECDINIINNVALALINRGEVHISSATINGTLSYDSGAISLTRADLINQFGTLFIAFDTTTLGDGSVASHNVSLDIANFTINITYDLEHYSWYIKPTKKIVNGQTVNLIKNAATDIVPVVDGDPALDGFEFYATSADLPGGLVTFYWWYSPDFYQFFIFSLIPPGPTWIKFGTDPPPCTNCLSLTLLANSVLVADASGIYTLVADKRSDTLYVRTDPAAVTTVDFKLPNPAAKIGFVP